MFLILRKQIRISVLICQHASPLWLMSSLQIQPLQTSVIPKATKSPISDAMALVPTLHHELALPVPKPEPATTNLLFASNETSLRQSVDNTAEDAVTNSHQDAPASPVQVEPEEARQVFERAPLPESSRYRQLAITTLIVISNLVQVRALLFRYAHGILIDADDCQLCRYCWWPNIHRVHGSKTNIRDLDCRKLRVTTTPRGITAGS